MSIEHALCLAPPLSDEKLAAYADLATGQPDGPVRDAMCCLLDCVKIWWELPESTEASTPHLAGKGRIVPLTADLKAKLFDAIPWDHELAGIQTLFDALPNDPGPAKQLRDAAFHLLWHVKELNRDREPITLDKAV